MTTRFRARDCVSIDAVAVQRDGRIVAVGSTACDSRSGYAVLRYLGDSP